MMHIHGQDPKELFEVSSKVVLLNNDKSKVLILDYNDYNEDNKYGLPGGHLEHGESLDESVRRELSEEIGFEYKGELTKVSFGLHSWLGTRDRIQHEKIILGYVGMLDEKLKIRHEPDSCERVTALRWIPIEEAVDESNYNPGEFYSELIVLAVRELK